MSPRPIVLLDRDGTINVSPPAGEYVTHPDGIALQADAAVAIRRLNEAGVPVAVVTNQRGIARGRMTEADLAAVNARVARLLAAEGAHVDDWRHCPHAAGACACRKPLPGMLLAAAARLNGDLPRSLMVGDRDSDVAAGVAAGVGTTVRIADGGSFADDVTRWIRSSADRR